MRQKDREQLKREIREELRLEVVKAVGDIMEKAFDRFVNGFYIPDGFNNTDIESQVSQKISQQIKTEFDIRLYEKVSNITNRGLGKKIGNEQFIDDIVERIRRKQLVS